MNFKVGDLVVRYALGPQKGQLNISNGSIFRVTYVGNFYNDPKNDVCLYSNGAFLGHADNYRLLNDITDLECILYSIDKPSNVC